MGNKPFQSIIKAQTDAIKSVAEQSKKQLQAITSAAEKSLRPEVAPKQTQSAQSGTQTVKPPAYATPTAINRSDAQVTAPKPPSPPKVETLTPQAPRTLQRDDAAVRHNFAAQHPEYTGGLEGERTRAVKTAETLAQVGMDEAQKKLDAAERAWKGAKSAPASPQASFYLTGGAPAPSGIPYAAAKQYDPTQAGVGALYEAVRKARWELRDREDDYASVLAMKQAEKLPADPEILKEMHRQAVAEEQEAAKNARRVPAGAYAERGIATAQGGIPYAAGPSGIRTSEQEAQWERQRDLAAKQGRVDTLAAAYYNAENRANLERMGGDPAAEELYQNALELKADLDKLDMILNPPTTYNSMDGRGGSCRRELAEKYGEVDMEKLRSVLEDRYQAGMKTLADGGFNVEKLAEYERRQRSQERAQKARVKSKQFAREHPYMASAGTVLAKLGQGVEYVKTALGGVGHSDPYNLDTYRPLDTSDMYLTNFSQTVRGEISRDLEDNWGPAGSFAYLTGMSMADFLFASTATGNFAGGGVVSSNLALSIMGSAAAADTTMDAVNRGLSNRQAVALGAIAGLAEIVTEKVSLDTLLDKTSLGRSRLGYFIQNVTAEGSEEAASDVINWIADILVSGNKSQWQQAIDRYKDQGEDETEAFIHALTDKAQEIGLDALGGGVSGGAMAGGNIALSGNNQGRQALAQSGQGVYNNSTTLTTTEGADIHGEHRTQLDGVAGARVGPRQGLWNAGVGDAGGRTPGQGDLSTTGELRLTEDKASYSRLLDEARAADPVHGWAVTPKTVEELADCRVFLSEDGGVGLAVASDGDIEAVFRNRDRHPQGGAMKTAIPHAISAGGTKLDCYGAGLVNVYSKAGGFAPVARVAFNQEFANPGWTADKGTPDIYVMMATDLDADTVRSKQGGYHFWTDAELTQLPPMDYDDAMAFRDWLLDLRGQGEDIRPGEPGFNIDDLHKRWQVEHGAGADQEGTVTASPEAGMDKTQHRVETASALQDQMLQILLQVNTEAWRKKPSTDGTPQSVLGQFKSLLEKDVSRLKCEALAKLLGQPDAVEDPDLAQFLSRQLAAAEEYVRLQTLDLSPEQREFLRPEMEAGEAAARWIVAYAQQAQQPGGAQIQTEQRTTGTEKEPRRDTKLFTEAKDHVRMISGALNPESIEASEHAERYYEEVRHMSTDVAKIVEATGFTKEEVQAVKEFLFIEEHDLGGKLQRFYPDYMISQSWQRLAAGTPEPHDLTLLRHEIMERDLMRMGYTQAEAHEMTSKVYNYKKEAIAFYGQIKKYKEN